MARLRSSNVAPDQREATEGSKEGMDLVGRWVGVGPYEGLADRDRVRGPDAQGGDRGSEVSPEVEPSLRPCSLAQTGGELPMSRGRTERHGTGSF